MSTALSTHSYEKVPLKSKCLDFFPKMSIFKPDNNPHQKLGSNDLTSSFFSKREKLTKEYGFKLGFSRISAGYIFLHRPWINSLWSASLPFFRFFGLALDTSMV